MKTIKLFIAAIFFLLQLPAFAQVQMDHQLQFTGSGTDAKVTGIKSVTDSLDAASVKSIQQGRLIYAMSSGSSNTFAVNLTPSISGYDTGLVINFISNQTVTGPATLNVNNMGAIPITKYVNIGLTGCEIQTGQFVTVAYDGNNFQIISNYISLSPPVAFAASGATMTQIIANWAAPAGATGYYLDVSTVSNFASFVPGDSNLSVGNVVTDTITGLICGTTYYYRVRAYNGFCSSINSNIVSCSTSICVFTINECNNTYTYFTATSPLTGKVWLDRNLGASEVATSVTDYKAYGSLFQWGRLADGHECINWSNSTSGTAVNGTTSTLSSTDNPGTSSFINSSANDGDWRNPQNDNLWQGVGGTNNPCPSGFRLPTKAEWSAESVNWTKADSAFSSFLKLTMPGDRYDNGANFESTGSYGGYWSSDIYHISGGNFNVSWHLFISNSSPYVTNYYDNRAYGYSVRCIKN